MSNRQLSSLCAAILIGAACVCATLHYETNRVIRVGTSVDGGIVDSFTGEFEHPGPIYRLHQDLQRIEKQLKR